MTKSAYYKRMFELATRLKTCKQVLEDNKIASFYKNAAEQFYIKWDKLNPSEFNDEITEEQQRILFKYEETVASLENQINA